MQCIAYLHSNEELWNKFVSEESGSFDDVPFGDLCKNVQKFVDYKL